MPDRTRTRPPSRDGSRRRLAIPSDEGDRADHARKRHRRGAAARVRAARHPGRAARRGREPSRRGSDDGRKRRGALRARWLHAAGELGRPCDRPVAVPEPRLPPGTRLCCSHSAGPHAVRAGGAAGAQLPDGGRPRRSGEGQAGRVQFFVTRGGLRFLPQRGAISLERRHCRTSARANWWRSR